VYGLWEAKVNAVLERCTLMTYRPKRSIDIFTVTLLSRAPQARSHKYKISRLLVTTSSHHQTLTSYSTRHHSQRYHSASRALIKLPTMFTTNDYLVIAVGSLAVVSFGCFFALAIVSNNRAAGSHQEVIQSLRGIHSNHIHLAFQQQDTSQVLLKVGASLKGLDTSCRRNEEATKRPPVRHISQNTSRRLRHSEGRCAQLFADRAMAIAEKTSTERKLTAAQDHIRHLHSQRDTTKQTARLEGVVTAIESRIAQLEHQERCRPTFPPTPPPAVPTPHIQIATTYNTMELSPIGTVSTIAPAGLDPVSDHESIIMIDRLELELAKAAKTNEELGNAAKASEAQSLSLKDQMDVMQERQYEELALVNTDYGLVKDECMNLRNSLPAIRREAEERCEALLQARVDEEKHRLEQEHDQRRELLEARLDAAEQKQAKSLSEQRKLETNGKQLAEQFEQEKITMIAHQKTEMYELQGQLNASENRCAEVSSEQRKLETDLEKTKEALKATHDDPLSLLSDDQRQQLAYYPSLVLLLYGDGTESNPGLQVQFTAVTMELDNARVDEAALESEVSTLTDTNVALTLELEELKGLTATTLAKPDHPGTQTNMVDSPKHIDKAAVASVKSTLNNDDTTTLCVGYVLGNGEKVINKVCRACKQLVALPHWQREDAIWLPKWGAHMKICSDEQKSEKTNPTKRPDEQITTASSTVAKANDGPNSTNLRDTTTGLNAPTPKLQQAWVRPPTYASEPTPEPIHGLKQCNKCSSWFDFATKFEKETFRMHVSLCQEIVCKNEGCGDVMSKDHFFNEHQQVCKNRAVGERKKLSFTEAAKLAPKKQDTFGILTSDGTARKDVDRASAEPVGDGVPAENGQHDKEQALQPEDGKKRGGLQGKSIWAA
jgi:hypothetical protein